MSTSATRDGRKKSSVLTRLEAAWTALPLPFVRRPAAERPAPRRVLVVEDHRANRTMLALTLQMRGFEVESACDGPEAVQKALSWRPDVAVVDIGLPGLDGYEVARQIRACLAGPIRLVAFTAHGHPEDKARALIAGFDAHLSKPADADDLLRLLEPA